MEIESTVSVLTQMHLGIVACTNKAKNMLSEFLTELWISQASHSHRVELGPQIRKHIWCCLACACFCYNIILTFCVFICWMTLNPFVTKGNQSAYYKHFPKTVSTWLRMKNWSTEEKCWNGTFILLVWPDINRAKIHKKSLLEHIIYLF